MSGPAYHGRTHRPGGTDPIDFTGTGVGSGPFFKVLSQITPSSGTLFTTTDWSTAGAIFTNDGGVQSISGPSATFTGSYFTADYGAHATQPVQIIQDGVYDVFTRLIIGFGANTNATFTMSLNALTLSSSGFAILNGVSPDYRRVNSADNVMSIGYWLEIHNRIYVSGAPVYWSTDVQHNAGAFIGGSPCSVAVIVHRLGDS